VSLLILLLVGGCSEDPALRTSTLNGAYRITSYTQNPTNCDAEGPQLPADARDFALTVRLDNTPEDNRMMVAPCDSADQCNTYLNSTSKLWMRPGGYSLSSGSDAEGWSGQNLALQIQETPAQCFVDHIDRVLRSAGSGRIRIEARHHRRPVKASDELCDPNDLSEVAPCSSFDVIEGELIQ
jgi:hypothetical protein